MLNVPQLSGPGWLAATGAALLLVASVVVVAGQWSTIGPTARFAGLVSSLFAVFFAAEAARSRIPTTGIALAVLAACVTAPVGIAAVAARQGEWPLCIAIGGGAALIACELQSRRWDVRTLKAATVAATGLLVAGLAVLVVVPVAVLGAIASAVALALGARRRSVALAVTVPFVPFLRILAEADIGPGVLDRMGVVGVADWVVPVSTLIAGITLAVSAHRSHRADVAATSLVVVAYSAISGLVGTAASFSLWLTVPGSIALLVGLVSLGDDRSIFSRWAGEARNIAAGALSLASWVAPIVIVLAQSVTDVPPPLLDGRLWFPAMVTLVALVLLATTIEHSSLLDDIVRLGCVASVIALVATTHVDVMWVAVAALGTWAMTSAITSWRSWVGTSTLHATWTATALLASHAGPWSATFLIVSATAIVVIAALASGSDRTAMFAIPVVTSVGTALLASHWPGDLPALAAAIAVAAATTTGVAMSSAGFNRVDALALSLGVSAGAAAAVCGAPGASLGFTLLAAQLWLYGVAFRRTDLATAAALSSLAGMVSLWWTTGTNALVIDWIAPFGASGQDIALGASALALLGGGTALRTVQRPSTWLAYSPGLSLAFAWLLIAQGDLDADWATLGGLVVGVLSVGVGGARRLAAPLVIGTFGLIATGTVSIGDRLASAPTWGWIAVGGVGLMAVAALLERSQRPILPARATSDSRPVESFTELFSRNFE